MLSGNKYTSSSLGSAIYQCLQQLQKCVSVEGEYFEGLQ